MERYIYIHEKSLFNQQMAPVAIEDCFDSFVQSVGLEEAQRLLQHDVGKPYEAANLEHPALAQV
jgi:hypothetical protein